MAEARVPWDVIDDWARDVVREQSPAEVPLFTLTADRYRQDPTATLAAPSSSDEKLGFGVETAVVLVAPFALDLVRRIFERLADKLGEQAADTIAGRIGRLFRRDDAREAAAAEPDALTPEQLALIGQTAREEAAELHLPPEQAQALANGVIAALATRV